VQPAAKWATAQRQDYIPSRLVENLYWLGRYTVRCENTARLVLRTLAARSDARVRAHARDLCRGVEAIPKDGEVFDALQARDNGLQADVQRLAWSASQVRNRLSSRYWRGIVGLQRQMQEALATNASGREVCERVLQSIAALTGFSEEDMMHDVGWRVQRLGRRIERLRFVAQLLARHLESPEATRPAAVEWLLDVCDSAPIYRTRYIGAPRLPFMLALLLHDERHPMALAFLRRSIERDLEDLARSVEGERERGMAEVPALPAAGADVLEAPDEAGAVARVALADELGAFAEAAAALSDRLSRRYFAHIQSDAHALAT
jgi:uncharacterized alpha-E superfamily protein